MSKNNLLYKTFRLYVDGFRSMTIGKVLWTVILIKLFVMFFVLKLFFFPDVLEQKAYRSAAEVVCGERRPIGFRTPSDRISNAVRSDSERRPIGLRPPHRDKRIRLINRINNN